jgi:glycosyltransferase involved in cell wall biosynthesis
MNKPILWVENVRAADILEWFAPSLIVYHVSDLFGEDEYAAKPGVLRQREERVSRTSDILICVSKRLYEAKKAKYNNVFYLPHGVDFQLFRKAANNGDGSIARLVNVPRPIAGYYGTMTAYNDIGLLQYCTRKLQDLSFVFAGQITGGDYEELSRQPNVYLLGKVPYEQIPALCASFNVCLLQWKMSKWIKFCNPLKFMEYMASGRPIVSVPINEVVDNYSDVLSVASTKEAFCQAIKWELANDTNERAQRRIEAAREHNWDNHVEQLSTIINNAIATKR